MKIQVINKSKHALPEYATGQSAGMDIRANLDEPIVLKPLQRCLVPTGLYIALPEGFEAQIRPRSGLAIKKGIGVLNSPGTIDADYRGEICIILVNLSSEDFMIEDGSHLWSASHVITPPTHRPCFGRAYPAIRRTFRRKKVSTPL